MTFLVYKIFIEIDEEKMLASLHCKSINRNKSRNATMKWYEKVLSISKNHNNTTNENYLKDITVILGVSWNGHAHSIGGIMYVSDLESSWAMVSGVSAGNKPYIWVKLSMKMLPEM